MPRCRAAASIRERFPPLLGTRPWRSPLSCARRLRGFCGLSVYLSEMVSSHTHGCLEPEVLAAYADHGLSLAERARVETHLASCPQCTALLAGVVRTVAELEPFTQAVDTTDATPLVSRRAGMISNGSK